MQCNVTNVTYIYLLVSTCTSTYLIFSEPNVDYEEDDANKGNGSNKDKFYKQVFWTIFESLKTIISLTSMKITVFFKIHPKNISGIPLASVHDNQFIPMVIFFIHFHCKELSVNAHSTDMPMTA